MKQYHDPFIPFAELQEAWHELFLAICEAFKIPQIAEWLNRLLTR